MKFYIIISKCAAFSYVLLGLITIGSVINKTIGLSINLIMGGFFIAIGFYLYSKGESVIVLKANTNILSKEKHKFLKSIDRFMFFEKIFMSISLLLGILFLYAAITRIFGENTPVFG